MEIDLERGLREERPEYGKSGSAVLLVARRPSRDGQHSPGCRSGSEEPSQNSLATLERWRRIDRLFVDVLARPADQRDAFLEEACGCDRDLRQSIEELLADDGALGSFLELPAMGGGLGDCEEEVGGQVGPYRILDVLGTGGMGTVYLAEQGDPVERKVALKLIKSGMVSEQVLARFSGERRALALMAHVNVAMVYEAGHTDSGRSYFAMEYVPGREIVAHCDDHGLGVRDRIRLFLQVCSGVQHAHQKGLIHRDLKPSNILVRKSMGEPATVKIIDFGIAKSLQRKLGPQAGYTRQGTFVGTPVYSSPEQILGRSSETDTRSDIYSLGVVLYELLVGTPPHGREDFEDKTQLEVADMLCAGRTPPPIDRFATLGDEAAKVAKRRSSSVAQMQQQLRGDVSWILGKCLESRPGDRYASVSELRQDLQRWLEGQPLEARPATSFYRIGKWIHRHRVAVMAAILGAILWLATTAAAVVGFMRAEKASEEAEKLRTAGTAAKGSISMGSTLPAGSGASAVERGQRELAPEHEVVALSLARIGSVLADLERFEEAEVILVQAWSLLAEAGSARSRRSAVSGFVKLYEAWHRAEPDQGYDDQADAWRRRLAEGGRER